MAACSRRWARRRLNPMWWWFGRMVLMPGQSSPRRTSNCLATGMGIAHCTRQLLLRHELTARQALRKEAVEVSTNRGAVSHDVFVPAVRGVQQKLLIYLLIGHFGE